SARDSGSHFQANITLTPHKPAATRPGAISPQRAANEPSAGPTMTPKLVAADSHPSALARSCGAIVSATYACATPVVPPPSPRTTALTTIKITPNAAATPSSETRRLDMISMEMGRLSYV